MATPRRRRRTQPGPPPPNQPIPVHTLPTTATQHLPPLPLVVTVLLCSGFFWMSSFRDAMATGKPILDRLGLLWGQDDADQHWLVRAVMVWFHGSDSHHMELTRLSLSGCCSNTPNPPIGTMTIPTMDGNPNRVVFLPSFPSLQMPIIWVGYSYVNCPVSQECPFNWPNFGPSFFHPPLLRRTNRW